MRRNISCKAGDGVSLLTGALLRRNHFYIMTSCSSISLASIFVQTHHPFFSLLFHLSFPLTQDQMNFSFFASLFSSSFSVFYFRPPG